MIVVVVNASSGTTRRPRLREELEDLCRRAGIDAQIREAREPGSIPAIAREALEARPEAVVAGGGDGTVSSVASVLAGTQVPLGVLPLGTLNHFAKDLHIPLDLAQAVDVIAARHLQRIDVGCVNDHVFVNNCSLGVYPSILETRDRLRRSGYRKWTAFALATAQVLRREDELTIQLDASGTHIIVRTPFVFVGNNEYLVEGIKLGGRARLDSRRLYTYFAPPVRTRYLPQLVARALVGSGSGGTLASLSGAELWVDMPSASTITLACDGELLALPMPLHFRSWAEALPVLTFPPER